MLKVNYGFIIDWLIKVVVIGEQDGMTSISTTSKVLCIDCIKTKQSTNYISYHNKNDLNFALS